MISFWSVSLPTESAIIPPSLIDFSLTLIIPLLSLASFDPSRYFFLQHAENEMELKSSVGKMPDKRRGQWEHSESRAPNDSGNLFISQI